MIVIDASVLVTALIDDGPDGRSVRARLQGVVASRIWQLRVGAVEVGPG